MQSGSKLILHFLKVTFLTYGTIIINLCEDILQTVISCEDVMKVVRIKIDAQIQKWGLFLVKQSKTI